MTDKELQDEVNLEIERVGKLIRELGNSYIDEGEPLASLRKLFLNEFKITTTAQWGSARIGGESFGVDFLGYENHPINTVIVARITENINEDIVEEFEETLSNFMKFFRHYSDKKLQGIVACVYAPDSIKNLLRERGIYLAVLHDETFELYDFENFTPRDFNHS